jgi:hypothetical protein
MELKEARMKGRGRLILGTLVLIVALLLGTGSVAAKVSKIPITGTMTLDPDSYVEGYRIWDRGGQHHVRGEQVQLLVDSTPDWMDGTMDVVTNVNFDILGPWYFVGPMNGTFVLTVSNACGEGTWEGTWQGYLYADGTMTTSSVGHGTGAFEGTKTKMDTFYPMSPFFGGVGEMTGHILDPQGVCLQ